METSNLIDAMIDGSALEIEQAFNSVIANKISDRLDTMRIDMAQSMFSSEPQVQEEEYDLKGMELSEALDEVLNKDADASDWIDDFLKSNAPQFKGKSKDQRIKMALAAYAQQHKK